jgi:D-3-phosphoglycerate dehydrogenase
MHPQIISLPHLGASTQEAEQTCAVMAVKQLRDFLEHGTINNSVNFPSVDLPCDYQTRLTIVNLNVPNMVAQISSKIATARLNIVDLLNKSREQIAYTVIDVNGDVNERLLDDIRSIEGVVNVRCLVKS